MCNNVSHEAHVRGVEAVPQAPYGRMGFLMTPRLRRSAWVYEWWRGRAARPTGVNLASGGVSCPSSPDVSDTCILSE